MLYKVLVTILAMLSVSFALTQEEEKQLLRDVAEIQVDKRFEQLERRAEDLVNFLWIPSGIFVSITGVKKNHGKTL